MKTTNKTFNTSAFVAVIAALSGAGLPVTGIANHIYGFDPLTLERHAWMSAHNILGLIFTVSLIWHITLHRRILWSYFRKAAEHSYLVTREAMIAIAVVALALFLFVGHAFHAAALSTLR